MKFLLDTCVISEFVKPRPDPGLVAWLEDNDEEEMAISVASIAEIQSGISRMPGTARRAGLEGWLHQSLIPRFEPQILPIDLPSALAWGDSMGRAKQIGQPVPQIDALLAAVCCIHKLALVTRNTKDFVSLDVEVINPRQGS